MSERADSIAHERENVKLHTFTHFAAISQFLFYSQM